MSVHFSMFSASGLSANNVFPSKGKQKLGTDASQSSQLACKQAKPTISELMATVEGANFRKWRSEEMLELSKLWECRVLTLFELLDNAVHATQKSAAVHRSRAASHN